MKELRQAMKEECVDDHSSRLLLPCNGDHSQ